MVLDPNLVWTNARGSDGFSAKIRAVLSDALRVFRHRYANAELAGSFVPSPCSVSRGHAKSPFYYQQGLRELAERSHSPLIIHKKVLMHQKKRKFSKIPLA